MHRPMRRLRPKLELMRRPMLRHKHKRRPRLRLRLRPRLRRVPRLRRALRPGRQCLWNPWRPCLRSRSSKLHGRHSGELRQSRN